MKLRLKDGLAGLGDQVYLSAVPSQSERIRKPMLATISAIAPKAVMVKLKEIDAPDVPIPRGSLDILMARSYEQALWNTLEAIEIHLNQLSGLAAETIMELAEVTDSYKPGPEEMAKIERLFRVNSTKQKAL